MSYDLETLRALLKARQGRPGYETNCDEIKRRIAELEGEDD